MGKAVGLMFCNLCEKLKNNQFKLILQRDTACNMLLAVQHLCTIAKGYLSPMNSETCNRGSWTGPVKTNTHVAMKRKWKLLMVFFPQVFHGTLFLWLTDKHMHSASFLLLSVFLHQNYEKPILIPLVGHVIRVKGTKGGKVACGRQWYVESPCLTLSSVPSQLGILGNSVSFFLKRRK